MKWHKYPLEKPTNPKATYIVFDSVTKTCYQGVWGNTGWGDEYKFINVKSGDWTPDELILGWIEIPEFPKEWREDK